MNLKIVDHNGTAMVGEGIGFDRVRRVTGLEM